MKTAVKLGAKPIQEKVSGRKRSGVYAVDKSNEWFN